MILKTCKNLPQVSDVAHGPLVDICNEVKSKFRIVQKNNSYKNKIF